MSRHVLGRLEEFPEGSRKILQVGRRSIGVFNVGGELFAVRNTCPHHGAPLCLGTLSGTMVPSDPDEYVLGLEGRVLRCPWHGWEFDVETGKCLFGVDKARAVTYPVSVEDGAVVIHAKGV